MYIGLKVFFTCFRYVMEVSKRLVNDQSEGLDGHVARKGRLLCNVKIFIEVWSARE